MKNINIILILIASLLFIVPACTNDFLEKPLGSDLTVDSIFSTEQKALGAISQAYAYSLASGLPVLDWDNSRTYGMTSGTLSHLSGEINAVKFNWEDSWLIQRSGMTADDGSGRPRSDDGFLQNYRAIRQCYLVIENIDKVKDMSQEKKDAVKAEMKTLIAYRYQEMFKRYGGVPIVTSTMTPEDDLYVPRASLQEVLDHVVRLVDEVQNSPLPDRYPNNFQGRVTKGVALAIKAEIYLFAARPLFNSATPYMDLGEHNNLISFGSHNRDLWQKAADAAEEVIKWANNNNYEIINTGSPLDDYGTAVATPGSREVLIAYKNQEEDWSQYFSPHKPSGGCNSMSFNMLTQYYKDDGTEQTWPTVSDGAVLFNDFLTRIEEMEPRYKASAMAAGINAWNNPNDEHWSTRVVADGSDWEGRNNNEGCGRRVKFWYKAGKRPWFEFPIYRLAEFYMNLAEAYNELDNNAKALTNLNVIRNRAGLPDITESNQDNLRKIIQRERAIELYEEGHRLFDLKHWKHKDIGNGIIGGEKLGFVYTYKPGSYGYYTTDYITYSLQAVYTGFWAENQYLSPIPKSEINKKYLIQNPGY